MRLPQTSISRPITAVVLSLIIMLMGGAAVFQLPISEYPEVVPPKISVSASYPGADSETVAQTVAGPLERQMTGLENMLYMESSSMPNGSMTLDMTFALGTDLNDTLTEVQNRVQRATPRLPEDVRRLGVTAEKDSGTLLLVIHLLSKGGDYSQLELGNYGRLRVQDELVSIQGVSGAPVFGSGEYAMRVWLDPLEMEARGLTPNDVTAAIRSQNIQVAAGTLGQQPNATQRAFEISLVTQGRLKEVSEFEEIVINRSETGHLIRLRDVARVEMGANSYSLRSLLDNQNATAIPIFQAPDSNALAVATAVREKIEELSKDFPPGIEYQVVYDPTQFIDASIDAVVETLFEALALVILVVIVFLQTWRVSIIPLLAVPVSIIGTFAVMLPLGFTINALSLFGLVLAIGIVVDDAIVVVENVERHIRLGKNPKAAARAAMREVSGPVVATTLVLCAVFIPTAFISGLTGQFYQQFALTIAISTIISTINSLTMSPALAAILLKKQVEGHRPGGVVFGWFFAGFNWFFDKASAAYSAMTRQIIRFSPLAMLFYVVLLGATVWSFMRTPSSFIPPQDKGYLIAIIFLPDGASLDRTEAVVKQVGDIALQHPAIDGAVGFPGLSIAGFSNVSSSGVVFFPLKDYSERQGPGMSAEEVAQQLGGQLFGLDEALVICAAPPPILGLGTTGGFKLFLQDKGNIGQAELFQVTQQVMGAIRQNEYLDGMNTRTSATLSVPRLDIDVDREQAMAQGVQLPAIFEALQGYFGQQYVNDFNALGRSFQVFVQADASARDASDDLQRLKVRAEDGRLLPLASFVDLKETAGPERTTHYNTFEAMDINSAG